MRIAPHRPVFFVRLLHSRGVCRIAPPRAVAAAIAAAGDILSQLIVESKEALEKERVLACSVLGGLLDGLLTQRWFRALHSCQTAFMPQLVMHQMLFTPFFLIPAWLSGTAIIESHARPSMQLTHEWWPATHAHWVLVAPAQTANAYLVPRQYQVLFANSAGLMWSTYLSWLCHRLSSCISNNNGHRTILE